MAPTASAVHAVILDLDGTLVDTNDARSTNFPTKLRERHPHGNTVPTE
jgi:beta-phosphoglucomutase-like phosphatase (HAD superfamily)